jgi:hypothetical protein
MVGDFYLKSFFAATLVILKEAIRTPHQVI